MRNVGFILVYVENVAASEAFYASILGRPAVESSPTFAMLPAAPGLMLGLWRRDGVKPAATSAGGAEIAFPAENPGEVDATFAEWRERGVEIALDADPDGFRLHFCRARSRRPPSAGVRACAGLTGAQASRAAGRRVIVIYKKMRRHIP